MSDVFSQSGSARSEIYNELASLRLTDPHTHINPHAPASTTLADLLGYHYYTELAHSAGMPKSRIEDKSIGPKELVERLVGGLGPLENTVQYSWLIEICQMFFGFDDDRLHVNNWEALYDRSESIMSSAQWPDMVLDQSNVEAVFLTNDFDDDLAGFDTDRYIPCLRTDDLVFHLSDPAVRERLAKCTGVSLDGSLSSLRESLRALFVHFTGRGARACAISLPPSFTPTAVADGRAQTALDAVLRGGITTDASHKEALSRRVFWTLAELCDEFSLPFDLMIGVNRKVYPGGVYQGQDLYDSRVSLIQYRDLFNTFSDVKFPVSVLASVTNQELVSYAWIFPNVIPNGHWWYSNTPSTITHDLAARLEAVPQTKMIGYYSDAYKLEFVWPKFNMYRKVLAGVLADQFVRDRGWSIERAVEFGRRVLKDNTEHVFPRRHNSQDAGPKVDGGSPEQNDSDIGETQTGLGEIMLAGAAATRAAVTGAAAGVAAAASQWAAEEQAESSPEEPSPEEPSPEELAELELNDPLTLLAEVEDVSESFDTVVMEPGLLSASDSSDEPNEPLTALPAETDEGAAHSDPEHDLGPSSDPLPEHPTTPLTEDSAATVVEERSAATPEILDWQDSDAEPDANDPTSTTDSLPMDDEIGELDLDDVELLDPSEEPVHDSASIATMLDDDPLDAGDLLGADDDMDDLSSAQIRQLRGETSFSPDEESLQLRPDPLTGELRFGSAGNQDSSASDPSDQEVDAAADTQAAPDSEAKSETEGKPGAEAGGEDDEFNLSWLDEDDDSTGQK